MSDTITFKVDNEEVKTSEVRVEVELPDGDFITVVLTHEGIVIDCWRNDKVAGTSSITYDEKFEDLVE